MAEQAEAVARSITDPDAQMQTLAELAGALAAAGQYQQADAMARSITHTDTRTRALTQVTRALAKTGKTRAASRVAAAACATGPWTTAARAVLPLNPTAFTMPARMSDSKYGKWRGSS